MSIDPSYSPRVDAMQLQQFVDAVTSGSRRTDASGLTLDESTILLLDMEAVNVRCIPSFPPTVNARGNKGEV